MPISEADLTNYVQTTFGANAAKVLAVYDASSYPTPQLALDEIGTAAVACPQYSINQALSSQVPVYAYEFDDQTAPFYFPALPGFQSLAYHTSDIQYLFPLWHGGPEGISHPLNAQQEQLSDELVAFWTNFARTGNPDRVNNRPWAPLRRKPVLVVLLPLGEYPDGFLAEGQAGFSGAQVRVLGELAATLRSLAVRWGKRQPGSGGPG